MSYMDCCDWGRCTLCGQCLMECPVLEMDKQGAVSAMKQLLAGEPAPEVFSKCALCFNCNQYCPEGLRPHELILQRIFEARKKPLSAFFPYLMNGMPGPNFFQDLYAALDTEEKNTLDQWSLPPEASDDFLMVGCVGRVSAHDLGRSRALASLPKFGPRDLCCGELHYRAGSWKAFTARADETLATLSRVKARRMVCYCGSCTAFFRVILPKVYGKSLPFEVISLYEWLWEKLEQKQLKFENKLDTKAAIHESCYVTELGEGFSDTLRLLYEASGVRLAELGHNRCRNLSCGAVSVARNPNIFNSLLSAQRKKFAEIKATRTRKVALNCPGCFITMSFTNRLSGVELLYMPELLLKALGDDVSRPLASRMPLIVKTGAGRWPLMFKKAHPSTGL